MSPAMKPQRGRRGEVRLVMRDGAWTIYWGRALARELGCARRESTGTTDRPETERILRVRLLSDGSTVLLYSELRDVYLRRARRDPEWAEVVAAALALGGPEAARTLIAEELATSPAPPMSSEGDGSR